MMLRPWLVAIFAALSLSACVPLDSRDMEPLPDIVDQIHAIPALEGKVAIGSVTVADAISGRMTGPITTEVFTNALKSSLRSGGFLARDAQSAAYTLDASMTENDTPLMGFSMSTPTTVDYTLTDTSGKQLYRDTIRQEYTAGFADSLSGETRIRMSASGSVRENVTHLMRVLNTLPIPPAAPASGRK